jgi:putative glutamine amidotransferase
MLIPAMSLRVTYPNAVSAAGGLPVIIPLGLPNETLEAIYDRLDGIMISGGGDMDPAGYGEEALPQVAGVNPVRDELELYLIRRAVEDDKPLLAICRGQQVLNVALGGSLIQDIPAQCATATKHDYPADIWFERIVHPVTVEKDSHLYAVMDETAAFGVNSLHHQAINHLGAGLAVTARAADGIIEAVELPGQSFMIGVQWHPEALFDDHPLMLRLFEGLAQAAKERVR